jgi:hypothetical protein
LASLTKDVAMPIDEMARLRRSLDATRESVNELVDQIDRRNRRRVNRVVLALVFLAAAVGVDMWARRSSEAAACIRANETRALVRDMTKDASLAAGEALIDVAGDDPDAVERYRAALDARLTEVVSKLVDREC